MKLLPCVVALLSLGAPAFATVTVTSPTSGSTVTYPVHYVATATTSTCSTGVASMGIYVSNKLIYVVNAASLNTTITLATGAQQTVVEEWDHCGGATYTPVNFTVQASAAPAVTVTAKSSTITDGASTTITVTATNSTKVTLTGSNGTTYTLGAAGGSQSVTPTTTTTYTAEASGSAGNASETTTVTVIPASDLSLITHVVFMLQENHTFDNYFGMLNPYRKANSYDVGADGKTYLVDGIDDKLNTISNQDDEGTKYSLFKFKSTCIDDLSSAWLESYGDVSRWDFSPTRPINMYGFVHIAEGYSKSCAANGGTTCSGAFTDTTGERSMG